jgi:hypothetical protein
MVVKILRTQGRPGLAEVDGNRTRRTGVARPTRFEGGGAHQVLVHLHELEAAPTDLGRDRADSDGEKIAGAGVRGGMAQL